MRASYTECRANREHILARFDSGRPPPISVRCALRANVPGDGTVMPRQPEPGVHPRGSPSPVRCDRNSRGCTRDHRRDVIGAGDHRHVAGGHLARRCVHPLGKQSLCLGPRAISARPSGRSFAPDPSGSCAPPLADRPRPRPRPGCAHQRNRRPPSVGGPWSAPAQRSASTCRRSISARRTVCQESQVIRRMISAIARPMIGSAI